MLRKRPDIENPRQGTETQTLQYAVLSVRFGPDIENPRQGTETPRGALPLPTRSGVRT